MYYLKTGIWTSGDVPYVLALQSIAISLYYEPYFTDQRRRFTPQRYCLLKPITRCDARVRLDRDSYLLILLICFYGFLNK